MNVKLKHLLEFKASTGIECIYIFTKDMESISNLVGISCEDIQMFLDHLREKEKYVRKEKSEKL